MHTPEYTPTPAEIRAACRKIRAEWSDEETNRRLGINRRVEWTPPEVRESRNE